MKRSSKKIISLFLTSAVVLGALPLTAFAKRSDTNISIIESSSESEYLASNENIEHYLPENIPDNTLSAKGECGDQANWTFDKKKGILTITGKGDIWDDCFSYSSEIISVIIESGITGIGSDTFSDCSGMTSITLPSSLTSIGEYAFFYCTSLKSITISNGLESIGRSAFYSCTSLTGITLPDSVTSIGNNAFSGCSKMSSITLPFVGEINNGANAIDFGAIFGYTIPNSLKTVTITGGETIPFEAFSSCSSITDVTIKNDVKSIGDNAFSNCTGLKNITLPDSLTSVGYGAFEGCSSLTGIALPDSVTSIGEDVFTGCSSMSSITVPFVGEINDGANEIDFNAIFGFNVPKSLTELTISGGELIPDETFSSNKNITNVIIKSSVTHIGDNAFSNCTGLKNITLPDSLTSVGQGAFEGCKGLTIIEIPENVTNIDEDAFAGCSGLSSITLPFLGAADNGTGEIDFNKIFGYIIPESIKEVTITGGETIPVDAFFSCESLTSVTIPDSITSIGDNAFNGCTGLTEISIPGNVTSLGEGTFGGCTGITGIVVPDSVTSIGKGAFAGCRGLSSITLPFVGQIDDGENEIEFRKIFGYKVPESLKTVVITGGEQIPDLEFEDCESLTDISLPESISSIGELAFYNTGYYNNEQNWDGDVLYVGKYLVAAKSTISGEYTVKDETKCIADAAFRSCTNLTGIVIPASVTSIGDSALEDCANVTVKCYQNSFAHQYAVENNIPFELIGEETVTITPVDGSGLVVDEDNKFISGFTGILSSQEDIIEKINVSASGASLEVVPTENGYGTGTVINIIVDGTVKDSYTVIIYGDATGDSVIDESDFVLVDLYIAMIQMPEDSTPQFVGMDCNKDAVVDESDIVLIDLTNAFLGEIDQINGGIIFY